MTYSARKRGAGRVKQMLRRVVTTGAGSDLTVETIRVELVVGTF